MKVIFAERARREFIKLDKPVQKQIQAFIIRLQDLQDPRSSGKALVGNLSELWRYRVGDYRIVCEIDDDRIVVTILHVAHRKEVYEL